MTSLESNILSFCKHKFNHVSFVVFQVAVQCGTESRSNKLWDAEDDSEHENSCKQEDLSALECKEIVSGIVYCKYTHV
jgi:hypothetical protein